VKERSVVKKKFLSNMDEEKKSVYIIIILLFIYLEEPHNYFCGRLSVTLKEEENGDRADPTN
jgi:hypothetical protein